MRYKLKISLLVCLMQFLIPLILHAKVYKVFFDTKPQLSTKKVYFKGYEIGSVERDYLTPDGNVIVEVNILDEYDKLMNHNVVFYVKDGKLVLYDFGTKSKTQFNQSNRKLLGFHSEAKFYMYYLKRKFSSGLNELKEKIITNTARLAKRQQTFNKTQFKNKISAPLENLEEIILKEIKTP